MVSTYAGYEPTHKSSCLTGCSITSLLLEMFYLKYTLHKLSAVVIMMISNKSFLERSSLDQLISSD